MTEMFTFIRDYHDEVPGASPKDCGNYLDMNLSMANYLANRFLTEVLPTSKKTAWYTRNKYFHCYPAVNIVAKYQIL